MSLKCTDVTRNQDVCRSPMVNRETTPPLCCWTLPYLCRSSAPPLHRLQADFISWHNSGLVSTNIVWHDQLHRRWWHGWRGADILPAAGMNMCGCKMQKYLCRINYLSERYSTCLDHYFSWNMTVTYIILIWKLQYEQESCHLFIV